MDRRMAECCFPTLYPLKTASECPYGEGGNFTMSRKKREPKVDKSFSVIPEYRNEIDVTKLCKVLIFATREMAGNSGKKGCKTANK